ncbi:Nutrient germinant receptor hydrophilic subunit C (GerKC/GerAC/GerBC) [Candidatus Syntrophocurvum alkaliphilum]|uniref:Nutrient germinant receptor hydrophilic subunit C (GerKC/GerAC/GerBC) n=1 Tax=Candidatus Syntrophocurvum alkaliphilum TaxID=2293317 RepID=A0A6I6DDP8_9FIRM|nr:Ger(x)C family spore germination protein [Candidatus Syntrophocurvum alkaliphilum]QGT99396.1 Nutrient germinant receptor hydrophilic subunit C (GerKC/GerAC/GerBC) [Candidatus Syntrophocurvum alkaliphilum]
MNSNIKNFIVVFIIILFLSLAGCWDRQDLRDIAIVSALGIDKLDDENILLTVQVINLQQLQQQEGAGFSPGEEDLAFVNFSHHGKSFFSAKRELTHTIPSRVFGGHTAVIIFGKEKAEKGLLPHLDFIIRDYDFRRNKHVIVADGKAKDILNVKTEITPIPGFAIEQLIDQACRHSHAPKITVQEFIFRTMTPGMVPVAPMIFIESEEKEGVAENEEHDQEEVNQELDQKQALYLRDTAVFNKDVEMVGKFNKDETRGMYWVFGDVTSANIYIEGINNDLQVATEIIRASSKITPIYENNRFSILVEINIKSILGEAHNGIDLLDEKNWEKIKKEQALVVEGEIEKAINKAKDLNSDVFGFGNTIYKKYPNEWKQIEDNWHEKFADLDIAIKIKSNVVRSEMIDRTLESR